MKTVWIRVGTNVEVTDEQYEEIKQKAINKEYSAAYGGDRYDDLDGKEFPDWLWNKIKNDGRIDGDTYIPDTEWYKE